MSAELKINWVLFDCYFNFLSNKLANGRQGVIPGEKKLIVIALFRQLAKSNEN